MICKACQHENGASARFCVNCGATMLAPPPAPIQGVRGERFVMQTDSPLPSTDLSSKGIGPGALLWLVVPGAGQFQNGKVARGATILAVAVVLYGLYSSWLLWLVIAWWAAYDAFKAAPHKGEG